MKTSELILLLQSAIEAHGDLPVLGNDSEFNTFKVLGVEPQFAETIIDPGLENKASRTWILPPKTEIDKSRPIAIVIVPWQH